MLVVESKYFRKGSLKEREVQLCLSAELGPGVRTEVTCPSGRIDVLSPSEVIEVKQVDRYKHALGQVLAYSRHFPDRTPRLHLFSEAVISEAQRELVTRDCAQQGVSVSFQDQA